MSFQIEILPQALTDIENAFRWIADNIGSTVAEVWYEHLLESIRSLESFPKRCAIAPEAKEFPQEIRQLWVDKARSYRVLFFVEGDCVFIIHVRHSSRAFLTQDPEDR
jgi:plasmid stabilization system protein ParE